MNTMLSAFRELAEDTTVLRDPDDDGPHSAVAVSLDRTHFGTFEITVRLRQIEGSQLAFVLGVARKYELEAREENGWLTLERHLTSADFGDEAPVESTHA